jgi:hypothetical protein
MPPDIKDFMEMNKQTYCWLEDQNWLAAPLFFAAFSLNTEIPRRGMTVQQQARYIKAIRRF